MSDFESPPKTESVESPKDRFMGREEIILERVRERLRPLAGGLALMTLVGCGMKSENEVGASRDEGDLEEMTIERDYSQPDVDIDMAKVEKARWAIGKAASLNEILKKMAEANSQEERTMLARKAGEQAGDFVREYLFDRDLRDNNYSEEDLRLVRDEMLRINFLMMDVSSGVGDSEFHRHEIVPTIEAIGVALQDVSGRIESLRESE